MVEQQGADTAGLVILGIVVLLFGGSIGVMAWLAKRDRRKRERAYEAIPEAERRAAELVRARVSAAAALREQYGTLRPPMVCPHCQAVGTVYC